MRNHLRALYSCLPPGSPCNPLFQLSPPSDTGLRKELGLSKAKAISPLLCIVPSSLPCFPLPFGAMLVCAKQALPPPLKSFGSFGRFIFFRHDVTVRTVPHVREAILVDGTPPSHGKFLPSSECSFSLLCFSHELFRVTQGLHFRASEPTPLRRTILRRPPPLLPVDLFPFSLPRDKPPPFFLMSLSA